jgi:hypothetical protein
MIYQRHVGGLLVFLVGGVWFNLQDLHFLPIYVMGFFVSNVGLILIFLADLGQGCVCAP